MASDCVFCQLQKSSDEILCQNDWFYCVLDIHPVSLGHSLLIAKRHAKSFFELTEPEERAFFDLCKSAKSILDARFNPDSYNIGVNDGPAAGRIISHFHAHLIPRKQGDYKGSVEQWKKGSPSRGTGNR